MRYFIYKKWDGTQKPLSEARKKNIADTFMENILKGMSPESSMASMFWEGFSLAGMDFRVMGLEEMLNELTEVKDQLFNKYSLEGIFDTPIEDVKSLISKENIARAELGKPELPYYEQLPSGLIEKMRRLERETFFDRESEEIFDSWQLRRGDITELYDFYSNWNQKFKGEERLDFDQALELMRRMNDIDTLRHKIMEGKFGEIDPEKISGLLGQKAGDSMSILLQLPRIVTNTGIASVDRSGLHITPRGIRRLGELAFSGLDNRMKRDRTGDHQANSYSGGEIEPDSSRPYQYGDRMDLDITKTIITAISHRKAAGGSVTLSAEDFHVRQREGQTISTTVVLLDLSWSMAWEGRFEAAKKVALALNHYIRTRFPNDRLHIIGFSTLARELKGRELALITWDNEHPFTNLQDGLRMAMKLIKNSGSRNNRVIVITDGQPTAYFSGKHLHVELPNNTLGISPNACKATLAEIRKVTAQGMQIDTFMLDTTPALVEFTRQLSKLNGGKAVICQPDNLGELILVEEIRRRRGRI
ncbi:MAG: VWA domain-containing protein [Syntrophales bacterium]|jgi:uncharacterized protein with von Willebrand factor type A (vWA) domain|nr:VWA domain-containing protein [Syntrophales bacterium]MDY0043586.1 VWA domain-containing protein [Syntrophales bacterium]